MLHGADVQIGKVLLFTANARREHRYLEIQRVDVILVVLIVDLNDKRRLRFGALAYGRAFEFHALGLDRFDGIHERIRFDVHPVVFFPQFSPLDLRGYLHYCKLDTKGK